MSPTGKYSDFPTNLLTRLYVGHKPNFRPPFTLIGLPLELHLDMLSLYVSPSGLKPRSSMALAISAFGDSELLESSQ